MLGSNPGLTQQVLSKLMGVFPSQLVLLLDLLEERQLIERRDTPDDRRSYRLHLTRKGHAMLAQIGELTKELERQLFAALSAGETSLLRQLLTRVAAQQEIAPGVHPAYRQLGRQ
jgi:DNA-binding MarR family transcriptional regulator